jgi:hypothetical protein
MIFEMIGVGLFIAAAMLAAVVLERRMDVLYGPYIEGCASDRAGFAEELLKSARAVADGLRWKARKVAYLASVIAC